MNFTPHPVQLAARARCGVNRPGFGYFMEQGLGKTMTAYMDFRDHFEAQLASRMVIVAPNSFKGGWRTEAEKYGVDIDPFVFESGNDWANRAFLSRKYTAPPAVIVNYEAIRSETTREYLEKFMAETAYGSFLTFDESIQLQTHDAAQTKAAIQLAKTANFRRILTGKPINRGPHDLWGQMRAIGQLNGRNFYPFKTAFCKMGGWKMKQVVGAQNEDILAELIDPHVFRALKKDWTDLPPKLYTERDYKLTPEMLRQYKQMEDEFVLWLESDEAVTVDAAITKYIKLAQIQAGFIIKEDGEIQELVEPKKNPRIKLLEQVIEEEVIGKVIVPYRHKYTLQILLRHFADKNPAWIAGQMNDAEVEEHKRRFNEDHSCRIIFLQTRAAKYGHTLLGDQRYPEHSCSTMVFFENTYSLDDRSQIEDRMHRHGQLQDTTLYVDLVGTPLDRGAVKALQRKEGVYQAVFKNIRAALSDD